MPMTFLAIDGFDVSDDISSLHASWPGSVLGNSIFVTGRFGSGNAFRTIGAAEQVELVKPIGSRTEVQAGAAFRWSGGDARCHLFAVWQANVLHGSPISGFWLGLDEAGRFQIGDWTIATPQVIQTFAQHSVTLGAWNFVEVYFKFGGAGVGRCKAWLNGQLIIDFTGDTRGFASEGSSWLTFKALDTASPTAQLDMDDFYLAAPDSPPRPLGDTRVYVFRPTGTVKNDLFVDGGSTAHEVLSDESDSTLVHGITPGDEVLLTADADFGVTPREMHAVQVEIRAKKTDTGVRSITAKVGHSAGTAVEHNKPKFLSNAYSDYSFVFSQNPDTEQAWDAADFANLVFGVKIDS